MLIIIGLTKLYNTQYITLTSKSFIIELADGLEISFEREIWFSEEINIERGYKLVNKFSPISTITEGWGSPYAMICERKIINYKKKTAEHKIQQFLKGKSFNLLEEYDHH